MRTKDCDLIIIGGGPAGLNAAINGASENLRVIIIDSAQGLGGQAVQSNLIENYPGFSNGVSGKDLLGNFIRQARRFGAKIECPQAAVSLEQEGGHRIVCGEDGQIYAARAVVLSMGLTYNRLDLEGIGALMGRGVNYVPSIEPSTLNDRKVAIIGGANSAGQAAMCCAKNESVHVRMIVRKTIREQMSQYLIDRILQQPNIELLEGAEVTSVHGDDKLEAITLKSAKGEERVDTDHMFIFIGGCPRTQWLNGSTILDPKRFILTGSDVARHERWTLPRPPLPLETIMPGVFACGDVRLGSTKRVSGAVGEGSTALAMVHEYLRA